MSTRLILGPTQSKQSFPRVFRRVTYGRKKNSVTNLQLPKSMQQSVKDDLEWVRANPLIREDLKKGCKGFMFDIKTGKVENVETD
jgi:carbonic anhydrase